MNDNKMNALITNDSMPLVRKYSKRRHKDNWVNAVLGAIMSAGLSFAIKKAIDFATRKATGSNNVIQNEKELLNDIRSGKLTEQKYVYEVKFSINKVIDNFYRQGEFDDFFDSYNITPSQEKSFIMKLKGQINKCRTLRELIAILDSERSPIASSFFDLLEPMDNLFRKAKTMRDSKFNGKAEPCVKNLKKNRHIMSNKIYHKDGFSDYVDKLITKVEGYIPAFKKLSVSRKIIVILSKILQVANGLLVAKDAVQIKKNLKMLKYWGQKIKEEKEKNPDFVPSKENSYYKNKDLFVQNAISVIAKLIGGVVLIGIEKGAMKQETKSNKATTYDSLPWAKRYKDKSNKTKEQIEKIERNIDKAKKSVKVLKTSKDPKIVKKAQKIESEFDKLKKAIQNLESRSNPLNLLS